ncbi:MAG: hypothetical protein JKY56_00570 [Kofleriaceae bacterium]|nr:hypothetical protein [Kofleriaceae bacterium]
MPLSKTRLVVLMVAMSSSCSYTALKRLPANPAEAYPSECTSDLTFPLIDMTLTVLSGVLAISLISTGNEPGQNSQQISGYVTGGISLAAASSALYGAYFVNKCRAAQGTESQNSPPPNTQTPAPGKLGGSCVQDTDCSYSLFCDQTMKVCVKRNEDNL